MGYPPYSVISYVHIFLAQLAGCCEAVHRGKSSSKHRETQVPVMRMGFRITEPEMWICGLTQKPRFGATFGSRYGMISGWIKTYSDLFLTILTTYFGGLNIINHHKFHLWLALHQNCQGFHPCPCPYAVVNEQFVRPCQLSGLEETRFH